jgi:hypothetical protein
MKTTMKSLVRSMLFAAALSVVLPTAPLPASACATKSASILGLAVTTHDPGARALFEAGLTAYWSGDAATALHAFRAAQAADPSCGMCHWGEALALGPRPQASMPDANVRIAWEAILRAEALSRHAGALERDLIAALRNRYGGNPMVLREPLDHAWATAMDRVAASYAEAELVRLLAGEAQAILRSLYNHAGG